ncbi:MAG TPA: asparagine synthase (glutamine-hydrolyzing) [Burkholderiales bacterium]|nr:asparagine synthase (glutamine-hydrolyzing) [Burkholderiales bacterium]
MAGIAGWLAAARSAADEQALGPMLAALERRGIASLVGYVERDRRRQAVLGASLVDHAAHIALVLDGAFANEQELRASLSKHGFPFKSDAPEETLLRAYQYWDKEVVKHLRGGFAFALWDARKDRLLLARDRFGEKPLYLHEADGALYFASEAKALLEKHPARVDLCALRDCLVHRYVPGPRTLFAGIRKLAPGSYGLWQHGKLHEARYWSPPDRAPYVASRNRKPLEGFLAVLEEAVALRAAQGLLLSGGMDSAVLLALAAKNGAPPQTFSLGFDGDKLSELPAAAQVAQHFGAAHQEIVVTPQELMAHLEYLVSSRDAPVARPSDLALCRLADEAGRRVKTVLTGDGCDEVLGGYRRYVADVVCGGVDAFPARLLAPLVSAGRFDSAAGPLRMNGMGRSLLKQSFPVEKNEAIDPQVSPLRRALYADQSAWLPDQLLERIDRAAAGMQVRLPFLDHRIAEYVSALPDEQRVSGFTTKRILREAAARLLPAPLAQRAKGGWRLDVGGWLRNELRDFTLDHLQSRTSVTRQYYDAPALDKVLDEHLKGKKNHETLLWTLLNLEIWHRTYRPG